MARPATSIHHQYLRMAIERAGLKVIGYDQPIFTRPVKGYYRRKYPAVVRLPGQAENEYAVIFWVPYMRFASNLITAEMQKGEVEVKNIPALQLQCGSVDWMWAAIEKWVMTYKSNPRQYDVKVRQSDNIGRMNKFKNQRTR